MSQIFRGNTSLSRAALAWRFAAVAAISAFILLPLLPAEYFYHRAAIFGYGGSLRPGIHWRVALIVPIVALSAFALVWVWARRDGRVYFSAWRGLLCALLTFLYTAVFISLLGYWLSDETLPFFRLAVLGLLFLPFLWPIPVVGAVAGIVLARGIAPEPMNLGARLQRAVLPLVLTVVPLFAILGIAGIPLSHGECLLRRVPFGLGSSLAHHGPSCRRALFSSRSDACAAISRETQVGKGLSSTTCFPEAVCTSRICARCVCGNRSESLTSAGHSRRCT